MTDRLIAALDAMDKGDWDTAHDITQDESGRDADWLHAHLHRVEGDQSNANYWYRRAGRDPFVGSFEDERAALRAAIAP